MHTDFFRRPARRGILIGISLASLAQAQSAPPIDSLTFEEAWERTLAGSPELAAGGLEVRALEARADQAGRRPNPELAVEAENFAGSGVLAGADGLESTVRLEQVIELGGKRKARARAARAETESARSDRAVGRLALKAEVRSAFTDVLAAQEHVRLLEAGLGLNKLILETARLRHGAGKAPATEEMKARMAYSLHHIEIDKASQELRSARIRLGALWGADAPAVASVKGDLRNIPALPPLPDLLAGLAAHPELARWEAETARRRSALEAARAARASDLKVGGGLRHLNDGNGGDVAFVAGVSLPLAVFDRNQGAIAEADLRVAKSAKEKAAAEARLRARLRTLHGTLALRGEEIAHLRDELLPEAGNTLEASREAYKLGKLSFLEVLDSQRTLDELGTRYIATLAAYHKDRVELESIVPPAGGSAP